MAERSVLCEAAEASCAVVRRSAPGQPPADPAAACGGALSVGMAPLLACLVQVVMALPARQPAPLPTGRVGGHGRIAGAWAAPQPGGGMTTAVSAGRFVQARVPRDGFRRVRATRTEGIGPDQGDDADSIAGAVSAA